MAIIAPSILAADWSKLAEEVEAAEQAGADWLHLDMMDGRFVPPITFGEKLTASIRKLSKLPLDVHLMVEEPERQLEAIAGAGADRMTVHVETCLHLHQTVREIKSLGCKAGVTLNPATPLSSVEWILEEVDLLLIMTVNPGWGGQSFIPSMIDKVKRARELIDTSGKNIHLQVDGGVNRETIAEAAEAGADVFVAGTAVFGAEDYTKAIHLLRSSI